MIRIALIGAQGRMGRLADAWIAAEPDLEVGARIHAAPWSDADLHGCDVALDLTVAGLGAAHAERALANGLAVVVGTSGVAPDELDRLQDLSRVSGRACAVIPNFSIGAQLLLDGALAAQEHLVAEGIREVHHPAKRDSPSGTALALDRALGGAIPIDSTRKEGVIAIVEARLATAGETLVLTHEVTDREAFRAGLLMSLRAVLRAEGLLHGLGAVLRLER